MRRIDEPLQEIHVAGGVQVGEQLLTKAFDLHLQQVKDADRGPQVVGRERLRPLAQPLEQHLLVSHGAKAERQPAELGSQRVDPFRVEQRPEGS